MIKLTLVQRSIIMLDVTLFYYKKGTALENKTLSKKVQELQEMIRKQEETKKQTRSHCQQMNEEIESHLSSLLSLQKELSKQFIS